MRRNTVKALKDEKIEKADLMEAMIERAKQKKLTPDEKLQFDALEREIENIEDELKEAVAFENKAKKMAEQSLGAGGRHSYTTDEDDEQEPDQKFFDFQIKKTTPMDRARPATDFVLRNFDVADKMKGASVYSVIAALCGKKYPRGSATDYALDQTKKSLTSSALLNPYLSAQLIDGGLSKSRLVQAGMQTFGMIEGTHKFAKITQYPSLTWEAELAATTERTITFANTTFQARTLRGWVTVGAETMQDSLNIEQALRTVFSRALANGVDTAGLYGTGSGDDMPLGIANYVGVPTLPWNTTLDSYDWLAGAQKLVHDENGPDLTASIMSPDAYSQLVRLKGTAEFQPVNPPFLFANHKFLQTTKSLQTLGDGSQSEIISGGFDSLNLGVRLEAEIIITPVAAATYSYNMLAVFRGDFQPNRIEDFALITGVDPAGPLT